MNKKKNIVFFVTILDSGGLENYLLRFLQYKASEFNRVVVFCKGGKGGQLEEQYKAVSNVEILIKNISFINPIDYWYVYQYFLKNKINIVCDFTGNFSGLILLCAKWAGINKRVVFYRGSDNHFKQSGFRLLYNGFVKFLTYKFATNILSNSITALQFFFSKKWKKDFRFNVIYNGINPKQFLEKKDSLRTEFNIPNEAFVVGHTGRFNEAKNHKTILKVAVELCKSYDDIFFIMCGNGVKMNLEKLVLSENLEKRIILSENRTDISCFLKTMNCYYFPSISEGQPNALIEALISGLPFVASNIEPIKETIPVNYRQQLIAPEDIKSAISKILEIRDNKEYVQKTDLTDWAIKEYDYKKRFEDFYNILKN